EGRHHGGAENACHSLGGAMNMRAQTVAMGSMAVRALFFHPFRRIEPAMRMGMHLVDSTRRGVLGNSPEHMAGYQNMTGASAPGQSVGLQERTPGRKRN